MADDFIGSIAQNNISFTIATSVSSVVGANFYTPIIYIGSGTNANANIVTPPSAGAYINCTAGDFGTQTKGTLLAWLTGYFAENGVSAIRICVYDSTQALYAGLTTAYQATKALSYQKFIFETGTTYDAKLALATLCAQDTLLSQFWSGTDEEGALASPMTDGLAFHLAGASLPGYVVYSNQSGIEPALAALGLALGSINSTGTPVGNRIDYHRTVSFKASGTTNVGSDNSNVTATGQTNLKSNNVSYFETVGNGTNAVALIGDIMIGGNYVGAEWFKAYFRYTNQVNCAQYLTDPANPKFKNDTTYQGILAMVTNSAQPFVQLGVLSNFKITAPTFANLPPAAGNTFNIPNCWSASYNRGVSFATVQGVLYVTA